MENMVTFLTNNDKDDIIFEIENISNTYGTIFGSFPTEAEIQSLPNNSFFTVRTHKVSENKIASYYRTTTWCANAIKYTDTDGVTTIYVMPLNQSNGELYLPNYGIKTGEENAAHNSALMTQIISGAQYGATFRFPIGHFYFADPIDIASKQISIVGASTDGFKHVPKAGTTFLHFNDLKNGEAALTVSQSVISGFTLFGNPEHYDMTCVRNNALTNMDEVVQETAIVQAYGIKTTAQMIIKDVSVCHFYYGTWCETGNVSITNVAYEQCHYGLSIGHDTKVVNIFGFNIMVLLQMRNSLSSAIGVRGDSVGEHLVEILDGTSHTLVDVDADFCMESIISIGNNDGDTVSNLSVTGVHGRANVRHMYAADSPEVTANDIIADNAHEFGVISVKTNCILDGAVIITNQHSEYNPFDSMSGYYLPFVLLSANTGTIVKGVQFILTAGDSNMLTEEWGKNRIASCSSVANACVVRVQMSNGAIKYVKSNDIITVIDDAKDIYQRMDLSSYARAGEVVKTINGIYPDDDGNVTIEIELEEPQQVSSIEECTDTSKRYVLPDGYIYAYKKTFIPGGITPTFTNQLPVSLNPLDETTILDGVGYKQGVKYTIDTSNKIFVEEPQLASENIFSTGLIRVRMNDIIRINMAGYHTTSGTAVFTRFIRPSKENSTRISNDLSLITQGGGKYTLSGEYDKGLLSDVEIHINKNTIGWIADYDNEFYVMFTIWNTTAPESVVITVNEEIAYITTEDRYEWNWANTGELYIKPDYSSMIAALEDRIKKLEEAMQ